MVWVCKSYFERVSWGYSPPVFWSTDFILPLAWSKNEWWLWTFRFLFLFMQCTSPPILVKKFERKKSPGTNGLKSHNRSFFFSFSCFFSINFFLSYLVDCFRSCTLQYVPFIFLINLTFVVYLLQFLSCFSCSFSKHFQIINWSSCDNLENLVSLCSLGM